MSWLCVGSLIVRNWSEASRLSLDRCLHLRLTPGVEVYRCQECQEWNPLDFGSLSSLRVTGLNIHAGEGRCPPTTITLDPSIPLWTQVEVFGRQNRDRNSCLISCSCTLEKVSPTSSAQRSREQTRGSRMCLVVLSSLAQMLFVARCFANPVTASWHVPNYHG